MDRIQIKSKFLAVSVVFAALHPIVSSADVVSCQDIFASRPDTGREDYRRDLRDYPLMSVAKLQMEVDLGRRLIQSLFVDTNLFWKSKTSQTMVVEFTPSVVQQRLSTVSNEIKARYGRLEAIKADGKQKVRISIEMKLKLAQVEDLIDCLLAIEKDPKLASQTLAPMLAQNNVQSDELKQWTWKSEIHSEKAAAISAQRKQFYTSDTRFVFGLATVFGTWLTEAIVHGAFGVDIPLLHDVSTGGEFLTAAVVYPGALVVAEQTGISAYVRGGRDKLKAAYAALRAKRLGNKVQKSVVADVKPMKTISFERTDAAFERAWSAWRSDVLQAESATHTATSVNIGSRISQLALSSQTLRMVEMPNGESYEFLKGLSQVLTKDREQSLEEGFKRKFDQIDLLLREAGWLERDIETLEKEFAASPKAQGADGEAMAVSERSIIQGLRHSLDMTVDGLRASEVRFDLMQDYVNSGERALQTFLSSFEMKK